MRMITGKVVTEFFSHLFLPLLFLFFLCEWRKASRSSEPSPAETLEGKRIVIPRKSLGSSSLMNNELARGLGE